MMTKTTMILVWGMTTMQKVRKITIRRKTHELYIFPSTDDDDDDGDGNKINLLIFLIAIILISDDGFAALGEEILAGFFDDETTKKPIVPAAITPVISELPAAVVPAKAPEVLTNEIVPAVVASEVPVAVVPIENAVVPTDEKIAEQVIDIAVAPAVNEANVVAAEEILEPSASEIVISEVPAVVSTPLSPVSPVQELAADASDEDDGPEGLIEGLVNTFTIEDGDGKIECK